MSARARRLVPPGPARFALEAAFIILVGVVAAVLDLSPVAIVVVMGLAWVAVAAVERAAKPTRARGAAPQPADPVEPDAAETTVEEELPPAPDPEPRRRRRPFSEPKQSAQPPPPDGSREWNLWELERRARDYAGADAVPEEWAAILMYLREFAKSDGALPPQFDALVRESFPELTRIG